jgi:hypothetical protein
MGRHRESRVPSPTSSAALRKESFEYRQRPAAIRVNDSANYGVVNDAGAHPAAIFTSEKKSSAISASDFHVIRMGFSDSCET